METTAACEIQRLPEELLVHVISLSLTSPPDALRAAAVSRAFRAVADSDTVWSRFLPRDLPRFAKKELSPAPPSKKGLFLRLSNEPALLPRKYMRMQLDRVTGAKCFTLSASTLQFSRVSRRSWRLIHLGFNHSRRGKRFSEAVEVSLVCRLEIRGKIHLKMLSPNSTYAAYMVFKLKAYNFYGWEFNHYEEATVSIAGRESTRRVRVCLQGYAEDEDGTSQRHVLLESAWGRDPRAITFAEDVLVARRRADGWMEVELGEFYNEEGDEDSEVSISLRETNGGTVKRGFVVRGMEIRTKQDSLTSL